MQQFTNRIKKLALLNLLPALVLLLCSVPQETKGQSSSTSWDPPVNLSSKMNNAWFPDIGTDSEGGTHIVYLGSDLNSEKNSPLSGKYDKVYYQGVSPSGTISKEGPTNIAVSPFGVVPRSSIAVDNQRGMLHMLYRSKGSIYYQNAPLNKASQATAWSTARNLDDKGVSYYSDIAIDHHGVIHAVWTQVQSDNLLNLKQTLKTPSVQPTKSNADELILRQVVMYRQSKDMGITWSYPKILAEPKYAATRVVLKIDQNDGLHVSWDDGYDNQIARFTAALGVYVHSLDNGNTWSVPVVFGSDKDPIAQTVLTTFNSSGVMLVWRVLEKQQVKYAFSNDNGVSWSIPAVLSGITARNFSTQHFFDRYSLATDGKGRVHFAGVGLSAYSNVIGEEGENDLVVYHAVWTGDKWSTPDVVAQIKGFPEYPRIAIGPDRINIVWFVRDKPENENFKYIWYASQNYDTGLKAQPVGSYSPATTTADNVVASQIATPTAIPILPPVEAKTGASWTEQAYMVVALSLLSALLVVPIMLIVLMLKSRTVRRN